MPVPLAELDPRRIVLIKPSALGDVINALPALCALRRRFPRAHITWVVNRSYVPLLQGHPDLDATLPFDRGGSRRGWPGRLRALFSFCRQLRAGAFDLAIDLQGLFRSGLMTRATGAPRRVGLAGAREGARWFYTDIVPDPGVRALHAVERCWLAARALGADGPKQFRLAIRPEAAGRAEEWLRDL